jgi:hypothetical protein
MRRNGLQFVPAVQATVGLHDIIKQICHHFFFPGDEPVFAARQAKLPLPVNEGH